MIFKPFSLAAAAVAAALALPVAAEPFDFVAIGDMPYTVPRDYGRFEGLITRINAAAPAFTIHVGDIKSGGTPCTDETFQTVLNYFEKFQQPVVLTPGDNDWTDCHRPKAGGFDPLERLAQVRRMFFPAAESLGAVRMPVVRQGDGGGPFAAYVENLRWTKNNVLFVTVHVVGSNNNFERVLSAVTEYFERNTANLAWLKESFELAKADGRAAMVIAFQADLFYDQVPGLNSGLRDTILALGTGAAGFGKPVLLVQGDSHTLVIDQPLRTADRKSTLENVFRLQVMGEDLVHGVRVHVDPADPAVFSFAPLIVPANILNPVPPS